MVLWAGRKLDNNDGSVSFDWPGVSAYIYVVSGTEASIDLTDNTLTGTSLSVFADRLRVKVIYTKKGKYTYNLLPEGWVLPKRGVRIQLQHMQEPMFTGSSATNTITLHSFDSDGVLTAPEPLAHRIEFLGDSFLAGYGNSGNFPCAASVQTNDYTMTFANLLTQNLSAAGSTVAYSGMGVLCNWGSCEGIKMWDRFQDTLGGARGLSPWDPTAWKPDAVVMTIGENDLCCDRLANPQLVGQFEDAYVDFCHKLIKAYQSPGLIFFMAVGPILHDYSASVQRVVDRLQKEGVKANFLDLLVPKDPDEPVGCAYHPSIAMNRRVFEKVRPQILAATGWHIMDKPIAGVAAEKVIQTDGSITPIDD